MKPVRFVLAVALFFPAGCSPPSAAPLPSGTPASPATSSSPGALLSLTAIQRLDERVGFVAGWSGTGVRLAKTADGGTTWQRLTVPADHLAAIRFIDERSGWVAGFVNRSALQVGCQQAAPCPPQRSEGVVLRTQDGGRSWQTVLSIPTVGVLGEPILQLQAVDGLRAWVLIRDQADCQTGCVSSLQRTTDGGKTWTVALHGEIAAIRFASASRGWAALDNTPSSGTVELRETGDGGETWQVGLRTATGSALGLDAATVNTAWLLTRDGAWCTSSNCSKYALFRTDNGGLSWLSLGNPHDFANTCSGGHLAGPLFASPSRGWFGLNLGAGGANVGPGGILRSEDGGWTWRCATTPPNISLVSAADPQHVWAAGENRNDQSTPLYTSQDAGATWRPVDLSALR